MSTNKNARLSRAIQLALGVGMAMAMSAAPAVNAEEEAAELERVQVTGSRLTRLDLETAAPVTTVTRNDIVRNGYDSLAQVIQSLPATSGSPTNTNVNNGGSGAARPDLRGLGSPRTLVLINGRRSDIANDLNTIPLAMVDRVEILKDGASAIYGADAVAGVINVITRSDFEGFEATAQYSSWADSGASTPRVSLTYGASDADGHFLVGFDWTEQESALQGDMDDNILFTSDWNVIDDADFLNRGFIVGGANPTIEPLGSSSVPGGRFNVGGSALTLDYTGSGESRTYASGTSPADFHPFVSPDDEYNYGPINYIQTPIERASVFFEGSRQLAHSVRAYFEGGLMHSRWNNQLAELPYFSLFDPGFELPSGDIGIPASNYYNPFGVEVTDIRRRIVENGGRSTQRDRNAYRIVVGFDGDVGSTTWQWDASYNLSRSVFSDTSRGQFAGTRLANAMGPSFDQNPGAGTNIVCGNPGVDGIPGTDDDEVIAGCVPINFFGGPGSITPEMLNYLSVDTNDVTRSRTGVWNVTFDGELFDLWGGAAQAAVGFESRRESLNYTPDSALTLGTLTGNLSKPTNGSKGVDSFYGELYMPFLSGERYADLFDVTLGVRSDDFDTFGSETSAQIGIRWKPINSVLVRATWGQSFREPGIYDLYAGTGDSFPAVTDPCSIAEWGTLSADAQSRCVAQGVPVGGANETRNQLRAGVGGNPDLGAEEGESFTFGLGWSPAFLDGFSVTVDYWDFDIEGAISAPTAEIVLNQCIREGVAEFCPLISRDSNGLTDRIITVPQNFGAMRASGVDLGLNLDHGAWSGSMSHELLLTQLLNRESQALPGEPFVEQDGWYDIIIGGNGDEAAFPKTRMVYRNDYNYGQWGLSGSLEYISSIKDPLSDTDDNLVYDVDAMMYLDLSGVYRFQTGTDVRFGITNVTDEEAPFVPNGFQAGTDPSTYRMMGMGYFLRVTQTF